LGAAGRAVERRQPGIAGQPQAVAAGVDGQRVVGEVAAHDLRQALEPALEQIALAGAKRRWHALAVAEAEGDVGMRHRQPVDGVDGVVELGARRFQEFEPGRRRIEEVAHLDPGARRMRRRTGVPTRPPSTSMRQASAAPWARLVMATG